MEQIKNIEMRAWRVKQPSKGKEKAFAIIAGVVMGASAAMLVSSVMYRQQEAKILAPVAVPTPTAKPTATPTPTRKPTPTNTPIKGISGLASYYSRAGCLGCNPGRIMANGEVLDDGKLTVAYNRAPLNSHIKIVNVKTNTEVVAKVTDRGGFENLKQPKIVDLSVATRDALGCGHVCSVRIIEL